MKTEKTKEVVYTARAEGEENEHEFSTAEEAIAYARNAVKIEGATYCALERLVYNQREQCYKASSDRKGLPLAIDAEGTAHDDEDYDYGEPSYW